MDNHTCVVAMTAHAMEGDRERCLAVGMDDYLAKPIDNEALLRILNQWLRQPLDSDTASSSDDHSSDDQAALPHPAPANQEVGQQRLDFDRLIERLRGDYHLIRVVSNAFLDEIPSLLLRLEEVVRSGHNHEAAPLLHKIKLAAAHIGAHRLALLAGEFESEAKQDRPLVADSLDRLREEFSLLADELVTVRQSLTEEGTG